MPVSIEYVTRETATNLWRNRLMTLAAILTVTVSLALVGTSLLLGQGAAHASALWERGTQVTVWMEPNATPQEISAVGTQLQQLTYVSHCRYQDKAQNLADAKKLLTSDEYQSLTLSGMLTSYLCTPVIPADATEVHARFTGQPGVHIVTAPNQQIHAEEKAISFLKIFCLVVAVVLILSSVVLILNTIRMAIFARRREVSVMKLVGATNWFIRIPFMSEGLIQGLIGSALAATAVYALHLFLNSLSNPNQPQSLYSSMSLTGWQVLGTVGEVVAIGVAIGFFGSFIAIRRFLDV